MVEISLVFVVRSKPTTTLKVYNVSISNFALYIIVLATLIDVGCSSNTLAAATCSSRFCLGANGKSFTLYRLALCLI